jgi:hypothetical protein
MAYQYSKDRDLPATESGKENPYALLLAQLTGASSSKQKQKSMYELWASENRDVVDPGVKKVIEEKKPNKNQLAGVRSATKKALFEEQPQEVQSKWRERVQAEHKEVLKEWKKRLHGPPSTTPEDRQQ